MSSNIWARYSVQSLTQSTFPPKSPSPNVKACWEILVAHPLSRLCQQRCCGAAWAHGNPGDRSSEAWQWMHQQHSPLLIQTPEASCLVAHRSCKERQTPKIKSNCPVISFEYYNCSDRIYIFRWHCFMPFPWRWRESVFHLKIPQMLDSSSDLWPAYSELHIL